MSQLSKFISSSRKSGENAFGVLLDGISFIAANMAGGVKIKDYFLRKEYKGSRYGWRAYASERLGEKLRQLNSPQVIAKFSDKAQFDALFADFLHREWLYPAKTSADGLQSFLEKHPDAIAKPRAGKGGSSIEVLKTPESRAECEALLARLIREDKLVEEHIRQHEELSGFNASSVNTMRLSTILTDKGTMLMAPSIRLGCNGYSADNFDSGGLSVMIDLENGRMLNGGFNKNGEWFTSHPESGKRIDGFIIPYWDEVKALCLKAAEVVPDAYYVGWDVAITPQGPVLVEGNTRAALVWQRQDRNGWGREYRTGYKGAKRLMKRRAGR
ncbi:MAG: hypothetical protein J5859_02740 [Clostridia bacterium]|nr:hypothetical protein [Clostridia bacterium]